MVKNKDKPKKKTKRGRKQAWDILDIPSKLDSIRGWCMQGSTDVEIMEMLGISHDLYYKWKREKKEFNEAIKRGKDIANGELLNSAFRQANGYTYIDKVPIKIKEIIYDEKTGKKLQEIEKVVVTEIERQAPANPTMNIFMLKNRLPEQYKEKQEVAHTFEQKLEDLI